MSALSLARAGSGAVAVALAHHRSRLPVAAGAQRALSAALSTSARVLQQPAPSQQPGTESVVEQFFADAERKRGVRVSCGRGGAAGGGVQGPLRTSTRANMT